MTLTTTKQPKRKAKKSTNAQTPQQRLKKEWQRVTTLQKRNEKLREELTTFTHDITQQIEADERKMADAICAQTMHLAGFLTRKTLPQWQKIELIEWLNENMMQLSASPFSNKSEVQKIAEKLANIAEQFIKTLPSDKTTQTDNERVNDKKKPDLETGSPNRDMLDDLFEEFGKDIEDENDDDSDSYWEHIFGEHFEQQEQAQQAQQEKNKALKNILKKSSMNAIFRRLARILHPDREQDENLKETRHQQMSELINAREKNDVFLLLSMYETHTGESPLAAIEENEEDVIQLLKAQVVQLQDEQQDIIYENPIQARYYSQFYAKSESTKKRKIKQYRSELQQMIKNEIRITQSIRSIATLKPYLEERYDMGDFLGDFNFSSGNMPF